MATRRRLGAALSGFSEAATKALGTQDREKLLEALLGLPQNGTPPPTEDRDTQEWGTPVPFGPGPPGGVDQNLLRIIRELDLFRG